MERKYFVFKCRCCGSIFYKSAKEITGEEKGMLHIISPQTTHIHQCDKSTSLLGIADIIGASNNG